MGGFACVLEEASLYVYTYISSETAIACPIAHLVGEAHPLGEEGHEEAVGDDAEDEEVEAQGLLPAVPQVDDLMGVGVRVRRDARR